MDNINWDEVQEQQPGDFNSPVPGAYIARILHVDDMEEKKCLRIEWDFAEGEYKDNNAETFGRAGFWPITLFRSYKPAAQGFFKAFKTAVETSNRNYVFRNDPRSLEGRYMGVVLGEEEYISGKGELKTRLYVYQVRSTKAIQAGDFKIPELKKLAPGQAPAPKPENTPPAYEYTDDDCPFL